MIQIYNHRRLVKINDGCLYTKYWHWENLSSKPCHLPVTFRVSRQAPSQSQHTGVTKLLTAVITPQQANDKFFYIVIWKLWQIFMTRLSHGCYRSVTIVTKLSNDGVKTFHLHVEGLSLWQLWQLCNTCMMALWSMSTWFLRYPDRLIMMIVSYVYIVRL